MSTVKAEIVTDVDGTPTALTNMDGALSTWNLNANTVVGSPTLRTSFNITSLTDGGTGDFQLTFNNSMSTANYAAVGVSDDINGNDNRYCSSLGSSTTLTTSFEHNIRDANGGTVRDPTTVVGAQCGVLA